MSKYIRRLRLIITGLIYSLLFRLIQRKGFNPKKTIVLFGSIRGGTTWLAEVLSSIEGHLLVFEPLHPHYVPEVRKVIDYRNTYVPVENNWPEGHKFFTRVLSGKVANSWTMSQTSIREIFQAKRLVVKFVRGNFLLEWLAVNMDVVTPILVIRHPCAIVASQMNKGWPSNKKVLLNNRYFNKYPELKSACNLLSKPEELDALAWCLRYHAPLSASKPYPFLLVSYENLVRNGRQELEKIFNAIHVHLDEKAIDQLSKPSDTVTKASQVVTGEDPLAGWTHKLTEQQIDNILAVLKIFDMDFYSRSLEPDYEKMMSFGHKPKMTAPPPV